MPVVQQQTHMGALIAAHTDRLMKLQIQAAAYGNETPPHVLIDIERIERELAQLKAAAATPVSDELVEELGPTGRYQLWMAHIMRIDADIYRLTKAQERVEAKLDLLLLRLAGKTLEKL